MFLSLALLALLAFGAEAYEPEVSRADVAPLVIVRAAATDARSLVLSGEEFGDAPRVLAGVSADALEELECESLAANELRCAIAPGAGARLVVVERRNADGAVEARHRADWTYPVPVVTSVTGGTDGVPLVIGGRNFGPRDAALAAGIGSHKLDVFVGPFAAGSAEAPCTVDDDEGTRVVCGALPLGFGTGLRVTVCAGGVCGTSANPLVDYPAPVVDSMHLIGDRLHLFGRNFGPLPSAEAEHLVQDASAPALKLTIGNRECLNPQVVVPDRELSCDHDSSFENPQATGRLVLERRDLRATVEIAAHQSLASHLSKRQAASISRIVPNRGATTGDYPITIEGSDLDVAEGSTVIVLIDERPAINCIVTIENEEIQCEAAPAGAGVDLTVKITNGLGTELAVLEEEFSYDAPVVTSASRPSTRGGKIFVRGRNFGPSFVTKTVEIVMDGETSLCVVEAGTHDRIQCQAPAGSGDHHSIEVTVAGQSSGGNRSFGYKRPDIHSATRPHWRGGHLYIRGRNFGVHDSDVTVYIDDEECKGAEIVRKHRNIRCKAPPGHVDGVEHELKVRVRGQSSSKGGHAYHHLQYGNTPPQFEGHSERFIAVAGDPLKIRLPAYDADGDEIYYRARGLPEGASWAQGFNFMQIEYAPPGELLEYPRTEVNVTLEVTVTDGPGSTTKLLDVQARACPGHMDACKDQSCAPRSAMCPRCPLSDVVRCSKRRPILNPATGACSAASAIDATRFVAGGRPQPAGYSFAVGESAHLPLFDADARAVGALLVDADRALRASAGPQPHDGALACVEVAACAAATPAAPHAASPALRVAASGHYGAAGVQLLLPHAGDGYGLCLGVFDKAAGAWHCADEALRQHGNGLVGGRVRADGCYALMRDNCPDHANPRQADRDRDGTGDLCQGGATGCRDCAAVTDSVNVKYLRKFAPEQRVVESPDTCAKNQCPTIIVTERGDEYDARLD